MKHYTTSKLLLLALLGAAGCSQIIGLSDYDIDRNLDEPGAGGEGGEAGTVTSGGKTSKGGEASAGESMGGDMSGGGSAGDAGMAGDASMGGGGTGELVDCDSADCCTKAGGTAIGMEELLSDGGFELGTVAEGSSLWTESSTNDFAIITLAALGWTPYKGDYFAYLAGATLEDSIIASEAFKVPTDAGWIVLSGFRWFQIDTQDDVNLDWSALALFDATLDNVEELPLYWGRPSDSDIGWGDTDTWSKFQVEFSATNHRNQNRVLTATGSTDDYSTDVDTDSSSFLYDDLSVKVFRCYK